MAIQNPLFIKKKTNFNLDALMMVKMAPANILS